MTYQACRMTHAEYAVSFSPISVAQGNARAGAVRDEHGISEGQNICVGDLAFGGRRFELPPSVSGQDEVAGTMPPLQPHEDWAVMDGRLHWNRVLAWRNNGIVRKNDSEMKLLEGLSGILPRDVPGILRLYTERDPCFSCTEVIRQFKALYPRLTVIISAGSGQVWTMAG